jgi:metal-responsive CopG/Arc/MetJ family transcriptional regulator
LPDSLLKDADAVALRLGKTRSALFQAALRDFLRRDAERRMVEQINAALDGVDQAEELAASRAMRGQQRKLAASDW